jgi:hypothetical protein
MYLPIARSHAWQQLTDYPRWVQYFPDLTKSEVLHRGEVKRLYQVAKKAFLFLTAEVEIYLNVFEVLGQHIQFRLEKGTFTDFTADLKLQDCGNGTLLTYSCKQRLTFRYRQFSFNRRCTWNCQKICGKCGKFCVRLEVLNDQVPLGLLCQRISESV